MGFLGGFEGLGIGVQSEWGWQMRQSWVLADLFWKVQTMWKQMHGIAPLAQTVLKRFGVSVMADAGYSPIMSRYGIANV